MLQTIRDHTTGWIAGVIVSLLIISFALWGISSYFAGGGASNIVAKVGGVEITKGQLAMTYERMRRQVQAQFNSTGEIPEKIELNLKKQALQSLIDIQALKIASLKQDYRIANNQVDDYLEHIPDFQVNGQFSMSRFQQLLTSTLLSAQDFMDLIKTNLLIEQPRLGVIFTSFALPNEVLDTFALVGQERNIQYTLLPFTSFTTQTNTISDDQVETYYKQHEDGFRTPEQVSISYIQLSSNDLLTKVQPSEEVLKNFYSENSSSYSEPMRWKLEGLIIPVSANPNQAEIDSLQKNINQIHDKALQGTDFAALLAAYPTAKKLDDKYLNTWVILNQVPNEWQNALLTLTKAGQVSNPIQTNHGVIILKAVDYQEAKVQPFDKVKNTVKETYTHQQAVEKFAELKEKLTNLTYEHPDTLESAATALGLTVKKSALFTRNKGANDISSNPKIRQIAFSNDVLNQQNNSDVIQINPDTILVLRINSHVPTTLLPLNSVKNQISEKLKKQQVAAQTEQLAKEIKDKLQSGSSIDSINQQYHLAWNNVGSIGRHSNKVDLAILNTAFEMPQPADKDKQSYAISKTATGYAVVILSMVQDGTFTNNDKQQYKLFAEQIQNTQGLLEYELYKQSQLLRTKIEVANS